MFDSGDGLDLVREAGELLSGLDPARLSDEAQVRLLAALGRLEAQVAAAKVATVAAVAGPEPTGAAADFADCEVAVALHVSAPAAARLVGAARHLHARLPVTVAAFTRGELGWLQVLAIVEATTACDVGLLARVEELVVDKACAGLSPGQTRTLARKAVARVDPGALAVRERCSRAAGDVRVAGDDDGTATLVATGLPLVDAAVLDRGMDAYARRAKATGDERTLGQLRIAALVDWAERFLTAPSGPRAGGRPVTVNVTVDLPTVLGLTDQPGEIPGLGTLPASAVRGLLADATLRRLVTDPLTGHLLDYGQRRYRPSPQLAASIAARYATLTGPGSTTTAVVGDRDHDLPYRHGGRTSLAEMHPVGRHWHNAKTHGHWTTHISPDGTVTWTSPRGQTARVEPHDYRLGP